MKAELAKQAVVEPEILNERGELITPGSGVQGRSRGAAVRFLNSLMALLCGFMAFLLFLAVMLILAVPVLILALFGRKTNIKIFNYRSFRL
jgi:hypothetical protein